jgi:hypothetical protein
MGFLHEIHIGEYSMVDDRIVCETSSVTKTHQKQPAREAIDQCAEGLSQGMR